MAFFSLRCSVMYCNGRGHRCALGARKNKSTVCPSVCLSVCLFVCLSKEAKYSKLYSSTGEKSSVVLEHFGRWVEKAETETYLSSLALRSRDEAGRKNVSDFKLLETTNCSPYH